MLVLFCISAVLTTYGQRVIGSTSGGHHKCFMGGNFYQVCVYQTFCVGNRHPSLVPPASYESANVSAVFQIPTPDTEVGFDRPMVHKGIGFEEQWNLPRAYHYHGGLRAMREQRIPAVTEKFWLRELLELPEEALVIEDVVWYLPCGILLENPYIAWTRVIAPLMDAIMLRRLASLALPWPNRVILGCSFDPQKARWFTEILQMAMHIFPKHISAPQVYQLSDPAVFAPYTEAHDATICFPAVVPGIDAMGAANQESAYLIRAHFWNQVPDPVVHPVLRSSQPLPLKVLLLDRQHIFDRNLPFPNGRYIENLHAVRELVGRYAPEYEYVQQLEGHRSVSEQIRLLKSTTLLISPHGAQMQNIVFMRPGSVVVELSTWRSSVRIYKDMAWLYNLHHLDVPGRRLSCMDQEGICAGVPGYKEDFFKRSCHQKSSVEMVYDATCWTRIKSVPIFVDLPALDRALQQALELLGVPEPGYYSDGLELNCPSRPSCLFPD
eukprot:gb/GEZN01002368.1/.p1 GENE.gb/GEZN01002368.1/~~gb/GEZN01002368.1/.p1  ORF type:complete len:494 (+),score=50.91 gb/GEZN01002368.1/:80-1561(+)